MATVLAIAPGTPPALEGRQVAGDGLQLEVANSPSLALSRADERVYDLLVLANMEVDEQNDLAARFQVNRRWRLVPVLFVLPEGGRGIAVPGGYRPEMDSLVRGSLTATAVLKRIQAMARDGAGDVEIVVAGSVELDPFHLKLRFQSVEIDLTEREAEVLAILLTHPNSTVTAGEIIQRGWGVSADGRHLQILRRHVSNIRRKLHGTPAARSLRTVRGSGYRFDIRTVSPATATA
ncbi:MAG: winged helix-turn-helix domain-containing protein [Dehalococcoidia bacterium]